MFEKCKHFLLFQVYRRRQRNETNKYYFYLRYYCYVGEYKSTRRTSEKALIEVKCGAHIFHCSFEMLLIRATNNRQQQNSIK